MTRSVTFDTSVAVIHLFERVNDIPGAQALGVEGEDLVVHLGQAGLALADKLRLERAVAITRRLDGDLSVLPFEALGGIAIAIVTGPAALWGVFLVAQVLVHLGIERGLDGELDQLLGSGSIST